MNIRLECAALRYLMPHVCTEESRPALSGVMLEPCGIGIATNGCTLVAHVGTAEGVKVNTILRFQKPNDVTKAKAEYVLVTLPDALEERDVFNITANVYDRFDRLLGVTLVDAVAMSHAKWRQVVPAEANVEPAESLAVKPELLAKFAKSAPDKHVTLTFHGATRAVLVRWENNPDAFGLCMPYKLPPDASLRVPHWVKSSTEWKPLALRAECAA